MAKKRPKSKADLSIKLFLSHSHLDETLAQRLAGDLRQHGIEVWYAPAELRGADQWHDEIGSALERCDWMLILLSQQAIKPENNRWIKRELVYALSDPRYDGHILPVVVDDCDPLVFSWTLKSIQTIWLHGRYTAGLKIMLDRWSNSPRKK